MDFKQRLAESSTMLKVYTVIMIPALLMHSVGFMTVAWTVSRTPIFTFSLGLWRSCIDLIKNKEPVCAETEFDPSNSWLQVVQVLESIGLATFVLGLVVALIQLFLKRNLVICYANIAAILIAGVTIEAGCVYFLVKVHFDDFGYSVSLSAAAGLLALLCTVLMIHDAVRFNRFAPPTPNKQTDSGRSYSEALMQEM